MAAYTFTLFWSFAYTPVRKPQGSKGRHPGQMDQQVLRQERHIRPRDEKHHHSHELSHHQASHGLSRRKLSQRHAGPEQKGQGVPLFFLHQQEGKSVSGTSTILKSPVVRISIQGSKYTIRKIMARMAG